MYIPVNIFGSEDYHSDSVNENEEFEMDLYIEKLISEISSEELVSLDA